VRVQQITTTAVVKREQKEEAAAMMVIKDDTELVELTMTSEGRTLCDEDNDRTWWVCCVQYDERKIGGKGKKYYEATVVEVVREMGGWAIPEKKRFYRG
jgi:hypothetical protein